MAILFSEVIVDELTGLPSRRALLREAEASIPWNALPAPVSVVLFDVDKIQALNEQAGRETADGVLRKLAGLFKALPGIGSAVCRHGGDSFLAILPGVDKAAAIVFAERTRGKAEPIHPGLTMSAGVSTAPGDGGALQPLLRAAHLALAEAKKLGRNRVLAAGRFEKADLSTALPCKALIGRDAEVAAAVGLLDSVRRGQMATLVVEGDPGSGKSRFLSEIAARARTAGLLPFSVICDEAKRPYPGGVLLAVLQDYYARRPESQNTLKGKLSKDQRTVLREAVPCMHPWTPELPAPAAQDFRTQLQQALDVALRAMAAEMPVLLLLDCAPAADALSLALLRDFVRDGQLPLGLALALKGGFAQLDEKTSDLPLLDLWREANGKPAKLIRMAPLTLDQMETLVCTVLLGADLPDGFPELIAEASCGNPLYVEAALRGLAENGKIGRSSGGWKVEPATFEDLPPSLDKAVQRLADGLPAKAAELLSHAAVMGVALDLDALQAMGNGKEGEVLDLLDDLEKKGLVKARTGGRFEFAAGTVREVRVQAIPAARLQEMKAKAGEVLIQLYGMPPAEPAAPPAGEPKAPGARIPEAREPLNDVALEAAMRFVQALTTELKVGRLYPKESRMRVELRERLTNSARDLMEAAPSVTFTINPAGANVNGVPVPGGGELQQVFHDKLISTLTLDRGVTNPEVLSLLDGLTATFARETAPVDHWDQFLAGRDMPHIDILQSRTIAAKEAKTTQDKPLIAEEVEILWMLLQALKASSDARKLYPAGHKLVEESFRRLNQESARLLKSAPVVAISVSGNALVMNGVPVDSRTVRSLTTWLATEFERIAVKSFTLHHGVDDRELRALVTVMVSEDGPAAAKAISASRFDHVVFDARSVERVTQVQETGTVAVRSKSLEAEENAKALMKAPLLKFLSPETERTLGVFFNDLVEGKMQRLMEPVVDRIGTCLRETNEGLRKQAAAMVTKVLDQGSTGVREILLRRLETPLAAAAGSEQDEAALAAIGNAVRAWIAAATALKQNKLLVAFMSRIASKPDLLKKVPSIKAAMSTTLTLVGMLATEDVAELLVKGDPTLREGAGRVAAMIGPTMLHALVGLVMVSGDITVRRIAAGALKDIGDGARQLAAQVKLDSPVPTLRNILSVYELAGPGPSEITQVMKTVAGHADLSVREAAAALLNRAKSIATPILVSELLARGDGAIQRGAISVAKDVKMREAGGGILKIAEQTQDEDVLRAACNYFRECPMSEALPLLVKLFSSKTRAFGLLKGMSDPTRVAAVEALRRLNHPDAKKMIERAATDGSETVRRAAKPPGAL